MSYFTPIQRRLRRGASLRRLGLAAIAFLIAAAIDRPVYWLLRQRLNIAKADVEGVDWWEFLRAFGYLPLWVFVGVTAWLHDRQRTPGAAQTIRPTRRGGLILLSAIIAGLTAELLKELIGRARPDAGPSSFGLVPAYQFYPLFADRPEGVGLGLPSSHTAVAFAGAWATAMVFPAARAAVLVGAVGCAASRILAHAHFVSDCALAAIIAIAIARALFESGQEGRRPDASLTSVRRRLG